VTTRTETNGLRRKRRRALAAAVAGGVILVTWMSWLTVRHTTDVSAKDTAHSNETKAVASASAVGSVANQGKALAKDVTKECRSVKFRNNNPTLCVQASVLATATPSVIPGPQGPSGAAGPPGPGLTPQQAQNAIDSYCAAHGCAPKLTAAQALAALTTYCNTNGQCRGPTGPTGPAGASGSEGASGTSGTDGASGSPGIPGKDAPTVTSIDSAFNSDRTITYTFHFSDNTTLATTTTNAAPANCPSTATVTPPDPGLGGTTGDPATPYTVCVPTG
jgi:hypothetical protein